MLGQPGLKMPITWLRAVILYYLAFILSPTRMHQVSDRSNSWVIDNTRLHNLLHLPTSYFFCAHPLVSNQLTMSALPPQQEYDYAENLKTWTQKHVLPAYPSSHHADVKTLFHRANVLAQKHKLIIKTYKSHQHSEIALEGARIKQAQVLHAEYRRILIKQIEITFRSILHRIPWIIHRHILSTRIYNHTFIFLSSESSGTEWMAPPSVTSSLGRGTGSSLALKGETFALVFISLHICCPPHTRSLDYKKH